MFAVVLGLCECRSACHCHPYPPPVTRVSPSLAHATTPRRFLGRQLFAFEVSGPLLCLWECEAAVGLESRVTQLWGDFVFLLILILRSLLLLDLLDVSGNSSFTLKSDTL